MQQLPLLQDFVVVMGVSLVAVFVLRSLRAPVIVGYLVAGVLIGPGVLGWVQDRHSIETMAEIGVILLLFTVGLEFSLREMARLRGLVFGAGALQVGGMILVVTLLERQAGFGLRQSIFFGFLMALSSTAVVFKLLQERGESQTPQGRLMAALLIFQDLAIVPLILFLPFLEPEASVSWTQAALSLGKSAVVIAAIIGLSSLAIPRLFELVVRSRSREVFTLTTIVVALGTAYLSGMFGLSVALGAFIAGLVISESVYSHQIISEIEPLRDAFSSLFFVSVGMLLDPATWLVDPLTSIGLVLAVLAVKTLLIGGIALLFGYGLRVSAIAGLGLAQVGEFSFIIAGQGAGLGLLDEETYGQFISVSVITMALTPVMMALAPKLAQRLQGMSSLRALDGRLRSVPVSETASVHLSDHVILVGYGVGGRSVARALRRLEIAHIVVELNPATVRELVKEERFVLYGDASREAVLRAAGLNRARALVIAIPDAATARRIVAHAHVANPELHIIVRTRLVNEVRKLFDLGADGVVPEELEAALRLVGLIMHAYGAPEHAIEREKDAIREEQYEVLCDEAAQCAIRPTLKSLLAAVDMTEVELPEDSPAAGETLRSLNLRGETGASISAVRRGEEVFGNPSADFELKAGDGLYLFGSSEQLIAARRMLLPEPAHPDGDR